MNAKQHRKSELAIERQLNFIDMSDRERVAGLLTAHIGEPFADAVVWIIGKFERQRTNVFVNASPHYWDFVGSGPTKSFGPPLT